MKRFFSLILAIVLCFSAVACGNEISQQSVDNLQDDDVEKKASENKVSNDYVKKDGSLPGTLTVNFSKLKYCVDTPVDGISRAGSGYRVEKDGYTVIFDQFVDPISETLYGVNVSAISSSDDVLKEMEKQFIETSKNALIFADEYAVEIISTSNVKVNSWNMTRSEGKFKLSADFTLSYNEVDFVAYSFVMNGYPVYFAVIEKPESTSDETIGDVADKIVKTYREYSED